jgi:hypothetical protein
MQIELQTIGSGYRQHFDLVLTQGRNVVRLAMLSTDVREAYKATEGLNAWLREHTMDIQEIVSAEGKAKEVEA